MSLSLLNAQLTVCTYYTHSTYLDIQKENAHSKHKSLYLSWQDVFLRIKIHFLTVKKPYENEEYNKDRAQLNPEGLMFKREPSRRIPADCYRG